MPELTKDQKWDILSDYMTWGGGFRPMSEDDIRRYIKYAGPDCIEDEAIAAVLREWLGPSEPISFGPS